MNEWMSLHLMQNDSFPSLCLPLLTATVYVMTRHQQCPDPTQTLASFCIAVADSPSRSRAQRTGCVYEAKNFCPSHCTGKTAQFLILTTSYCLSLLRTQNLSVETTVTCDGPMSSTHGGCRRMQWLTNRVGRLRRNSSTLSLYARTVSRHLTLV